MAGKCPHCHSPMHPTVPGLYECGVSSPLVRHQPREFHRTKKCFGRQVSRLLSAFHAAIARPKGTVPAEYDDLYDEEHPELRRNP